MAINATHNPGERLSIYALAAVVLAGLVGAAFATGWLLGRILL